MSERPHWKDIAHELARRVAYLVESCEHDGVDPVEACCLDRLAYERFVAAGGRDYRADWHRHVQSLESVSIVEVSCRPPFSGA